MRKIMVTGAFGQIGSELVPALQSKFGHDNVVAVDINQAINFDGLSERANVLEPGKLQELIEKHDIGVVYHLVALLSAKGEEDPTSTWNINMGGLKSVLDLGVSHHLQVFWPSSIAAFGPSTPPVKTPQSTIQEPTTMYGVTKVSGELLCRYYHQKYGLDVRTLRFPGIVSWKTPPGGGTSDYAVAIFYEAIKTGKYQCFVSEDTKIPMMYIDDAVQATIQLMDTDKEKLTVYKPYNIASLDFTAKELAEAVNKVIPVSVTYSPDFRQAIANSWPKSLDDREARQDWNWQPHFDLDKMCQTMVDGLKNKLI